MTTMYPVKLSVTLRAVNNQRPLPVKLSIDTNWTTIKVTDTITVHYEFESAGQCDLVVQLADKQDQEAVIVDSVSFFGITDPKFAWAGIYEPEYPEPWASQQRSAGVVLKPQLFAHTYLGWPGQWRLTFEVPVFTWIHKIQNLGWIYR